MGELTAERLSELRKIAEAATPGPWEWREREHNERIRKRERAGRRSRRQFVYCLQGPPLSGVASEHRDEFDYHNVMSLRWDQVKATTLTGVAPTPADADFIAAFDPTTVLALLDEIDHLRKQRDTLISGISNIADNVLALLDRIEELEAVLRLVYDEFVLDVARWCRHCRLRIDDHAPECPMAEVERVLGLAGGATDA